MGAGSGLLWTILGGLITLAILSFLFARRLGTARLDAAASAGVDSASTAAFAVFAALCLLGALASAVRGRAPAPPS